MSSPTESTDTDVYDNFNLTNATVATTIPNACSSTYCHQLLLRYAKFSTLSKYTFWVSLPCSADTLAVTVIGCITAATSDLEMRSYGITGIHSIVVNDRITCKKCKLEKVLW